MTTLLAISLFAAAIVRGYTGFGLSAILITVVTYQKSAQELVPLLILLEITSSLLFYRSISLDVNWKAIAIIFIGSAISTPFALHLLMVLPSSQTHLLIAMLVLAAAITLLINSRIAFKPTFITWICTGLIMGVFAGLGSIGGLAGMVMLLSALSPTRSRATMIVLLLTTSTYTAIISTYHGMMSLQVFNLWLVSLIPLIPGLYIGHVLFKNYKKSFRKITLMLLATLSVAMLAEHFIQPAQWG